MIGAFSFPLFSPILAGRQEITPYTVGGSSPINRGKLIGSYKKKVQSTKRNRVFSSKLGFFARFLNMSELIIGAGRCGFQPHRLGTVGNSAYPTRER